MRECMPVTKKNETNLNQQDTEQKYSKLKKNNSAKQTNIRKREQSYAQDIYKNASNNNNCRIKISWNCQMHMKST
jgi:hypothetical protein